MTIREWWKARQERIQREHNEAYEARRRNMALKCICGHYRWQHNDIIVQSVVGVLGLNCLIRSCVCQQFMQELPQEQK